MRKLNRAWAALLVLLTSCFFEPKDGQDAEPGYLSLEVSLKHNANALMKIAAGDTVFNVDSLKIILSAPGAATATYAYGIDGRADTGNITVVPKIYSLAPLRTWQAKVFTLDTLSNPARTDTIHMDSVSFTIRPSDTTLVARTINPAFSLLMARFYSNSPASIANNVKYVRIRVDGTTRDSAQVGTALRALSYGNNSNGCAVGDSGNLIRTINAGLNWTAVSSGSVKNLNGISFPSNNNGFVVGDAGTVLKTTNAGAAWTAQSSGVTGDLNGVHFTANTTGFAVGDAGIILKSDGSAWTAKTSGTTRNLHGVYFTGASAGYAVGALGTIRKTSDGAATWSALTSGTTRNLNAVHFPTASVGYAVGDSGTILKTVNSGTSWTALASGTTQKLTGVRFTGNNDGWAVGDSGIMLATANGTSWSVVATGTQQHFSAIAFTPNENIATAVGKTGTLVRSGDVTTWTTQYFGTKVFDLKLSYKYLTPNASHTLLMQAIDTLAGTLRGYQVVNTLTLTPGRDTIVMPGTGLVKCGYSGFSACTP